MNSYAPPKTSVADIAPPGRTLRGFDYFKAWICFAMLSTLAGVAIGAVLGGVSGSLLGAARMSAGIIGIVAAIAGAAGSLIASYFIFRYFVGLFIVRKLVGTGGSGAS